MKLYHGTSAKNLDSILREGIRPRGKVKGNWKHTIESNSHAVYLTRSYGPYFALQASANYGALILEIETARLNTFRLLPDEDAIEQSTRGKDGIGGTMRYRTAYYRRRMNEYADGEAWKVSVKLLGTCCHKGTIPPDAITRATIVPAKHAIELLLNWDASVTIMNQQILGDCYLQKTLRLFDDNAAAEAMEGSPAFAGDWQIAVDEARVLTIEGGKIVAERTHSKPDERRRFFAEELSALAPAVE